MVNTTNYNEQGFCLFFLIHQTKCKIKEWILCWNFTDKRTFLCLHSTLNLNINCNVQWLEETSVPSFHLIEVGANVIKSHAKVTVTAISITTRAQPGALTLQYYAEKEKLSNTASVHLLLWKFGWKRPIQTHIVSCLVHSWTNWELEGVTLLEKVCYEYVALMFQKVMPSTVFLSSPTAWRLGGKALNYFLQHHVCHNVPSPWW